jgi:hypothetical protein
MCGTAACTSLRIDTGRQDRPGVAVTIGGHQAYQMAHMSAEGANKWNAGDCLPAMLS